MLFHRPLEYIDPVSGSILIQTILATVAGGAAFFRKSIWSILSRRKNGKPDGARPDPNYKDHGTENR